MHVRLFVIPEEQNTEGTRFAQLQIPLERSGRQNLQGTEH
jgi:hypothetical protein